MNPKLRAGALVTSMFAVFFGASGAHADETFRCPTDRLVRVGDALEDARTRCGTPDRVAQRTERRRISVPVEGPIPGFIEQEIETAVEEWFFNLGSDRFVRIVRFENGRLTTITTGRYGASKR